jgi:hypothetical protein
MLARLWHNILSATYRVPRFSQPKINEKAVEAFQVRKRGKSYDT